MNAEKSNRMAYNIAIGLAIYMLVLFTSCERRPLVNPEIEKALVEKTIRASIGWAKEKDIDLLYSVIAHDPNYLEVQPGDRVVKGFEEFRQSEKFWMDPDFSAIHYEIWDLAINLSTSLNVAWFYCMLNDINEWKGQPASWEDTRWTGVLEKRDGRWVIVQMHFSFASN